MYARLREGRQPTVVGITVGSLRAFVVLVYGADPDCSKTCILNVVKVLPDGIPGSPTPTGSEKEFDGSMKGGSTRSYLPHCKRLCPHRLEVRSGP